MIVYNNNDGTYTINFNDGRQPILLTQDEVNEFVSQLSGLDYSDNFLFEFAKQLRENMKKYITYKLDDSDIKYFIRDYIHRKLQKCHSEQ